MSDALGYGMRVVRVTDGKTVAEKIDGVWTCRVGTEQPAVLWQPPNFAFPAPKLVGATTVQGHRAWDVQGTWVHRRRGTTTRLRIDVLVDQDRSVYLESKATGTVTSGNGAIATIAATVTYYDYGHWVT